MSREGKFKIKVWYCGEPVIRWKDESLDKLADRIRTLTKKFK